MPKVTVIVPVYNVEQYLKRCIDSILNQSFQDFELICVNDCSPDNSQKLLEQYEKEYPGKVKVLVNEENMGQGRSRERGIALAQGQYVMFIDSDDYVRRDYLETYVKKIKETGVDVVVGGYTRDAGGKFTEHTVSDSDWSMVTYTIACAKMYRREFLVKNQIGFSGIRRGEDIYFCLSVYYHNASYTVMDYTGYYYYYNPKSTTGSLNYEKNFERFVSEIFRSFLENHPLTSLSEERVRVIEYDYIANMVNALITYGRGGGVKRMKEKYQFWMKDMEQLFPDYRHNPHVGIFKPAGQTMKIRLGVGITMELKRVHLDKLLLYLVSIL